MSNAIKIFGVILSAANVLLIGGSLLLLAAFSANAVISAW